MPLWAVVGENSAPVAPPKRIVSRLLKAFRGHLAVWAHRANSLDMKYTSIFFAALQRHSFGWFSSSFLFFCFFIAACPSQNTNVSTENGNPQTDAAHALQNPVQKAPILLDVSLWATQEMWIHTAEQFTQIHDAAQIKNVAVTAIAAGMNHHDVDINSEKNTKKRYCIQLLSTLQESEARQFLWHLDEENLRIPLQVVLMTAEIPNQKTRQKEQWWRLCVGDYETIPEARQAGAALLANYPVVAMMSKSQYIAQERTGVVEELQKKYVYIQKKTAESVTIRGENPQAFFVIAKNKNIPANTHTDIHADIPDEKTQLLSITDEKQNQWILDKTYPTSCAVCQELQYPLAAQQLVLVGNIWPSADDAAGDEMLILETDQAGRQILSFVVAELKIKEKTNLQNEKNIQKHRWRRQASVLWNTVDLEKYREQMQRGQKTVWDESLNINAAAAVVAAPTKPTILLLQPNKTMLTRCYALDTPHTQNNAPEKQDEKQDEKHVNLLSRLQNCPRVTAMSLDFYRDFHTASMACAGSEDERIPVVSTVATASAAKISTRQKNEIDYCTARIAALWTLHKQQNLHKDMAILAAAATLSAWQYFSPNEESSKTATSFLLSLPKENWENFTEIESIDDNFYAIAAQSQRIAEKIAEKSSLPTAPSLSLQTIAGRWLTRLQGVAPARAQAVLAKAKTRALEQEMQATVQKVLGENPK